VDDMSVAVAAVLGVAAGALLVVTLAFLPPDGWAWVQRRQVAREREVAGSLPAPPGTFRALAVLDELPTATVVLDGNDEVLFANGAAQSIGVIHGNRLALAELRDVIRSTRRDGRVREMEVDLAPTVPRRRPLAVRARVVAAGGQDVAVVVDDLTEARRVEAVRRDFVANVSHELKTPVGAISLLAEAMLDGADEPATVRHFAERVQHESQRLSRLVQELIALSRLQGAEPLPDPRPVSLRQVVTEAIDRARLSAVAKDIAIAYDASDAVVLGDAELLVTAVGNLIDNAVVYSPPATRVTVGVREEDGVAQLWVSDQGIGIAADDVERVFERFYRVDPARSRDTGGTGLGLSIVKHIVTNHGGTVGVWSAPGEGSTFTVRLDAARPGQRTGGPTNDPVAGTPTGRSDR
jgi:two-component system sensor histidine kinase SenX3